MTATAEQLARAIAKAETATTNSAGTLAVLPLDRVYLFTSSADGTTDTHGTYFGSALGQCEQEENV